VVRVVTSDFRDKPRRLLDVSITSPNTADDIFKLNIPGSGLRRFYKELAIGAEWVDDRRD
jgi:hypothetical protein